MATLGRDQVDIRVMAYQAVMLNGKIIHLDPPLGSSLSD